MSSRALIGLDRFLKERGLGLGPIARSVGLQPGAIRDPNAMLPLKEVATLFERAAQRSGDRAFGLRFAESVDIRDGSLLYYVMANSATLRDALHAQARYGRLMFTELELSLDEGQGPARWTWTLPKNLGPRAHFVEFLVGAQVRRLDLLLGKRLLPPRVELDQAPTAPMAEYQRLFRGQVAFKCPRPALLIDRKTLSHRIAEADPQLHAILEKASRTALEQVLQEQDLLWRAGKTLVGLLKQGKPNLAEIATSLVVARRSLQLELSRAGITFQDLIDETRRREAEHLLLETTTPITEIAFSLGYSEASAFSRAFKSWFGCSPRQFRGDRRSR